MRVPGLVISPYVRRGHIDHQVLSFDAFNKFIEDDYLAADGRAEGSAGIRHPCERPDRRRLGRDRSVGSPGELGLVVRGHDQAEPPRRNRAADHDPRAERRLPALRLTWAWRLRSADVEPDGVGQALSRPG